MLHVRPPPASLFPDLGDEEKTEFTFAELHNAAKERARDCYRADGLPDEWWDSTYGDAETIAELLGISIDRRSHKTVGGATFTAPAIYHSGFCCQGDGATFEGTWSRPSHDIGAKVRDHAGTDEKLHAIADTFAGLAARCAHRNVDVRVVHTGSYCHEFSNTISVSFEDTNDGNGLNDLVRTALDTANNLDGFEVDIAAALRSFMKWIYRQLEEEYEYLTSDEAVDEALADTVFDENGDLF